MIHRHTFNLTQARLITVLLLVLVSWLQPIRVHADPGNSGSQLFLPIATKTDTVAASESSCQLNDQEKRIEELLRKHPEQGRIKLSCHPTLASVARARAEDMGRRAYFAHVNPDGHGANYLVRQGGYVLPSSYSQEVNGNNIESIGAGPNNSDSMWDAWMKSSKHNTHLLGKTSFFAEQLEYGIGFAEVPGSPYQYYWVFISARPGP